VTAAPSSEIFPKYDFRHLEIAQNEGGDSMNEHRVRGAHVFMDYVGAHFEVDDAANWVLSVLRQAVAQSPATEVHAHVEAFDGSTSPPGFAAVVLIDESHITAHCYADRGMLALDCFTCGSTNPDDLADVIHEALVVGAPDLNLVRRERVERFLTEV
jgi:S-adenosylmethionine decarboxylase